MARNKQHLTGRQAKFLNTLALGRMTVEQVERHLGLACYTLRRWMDQKPFLAAWAKTNILLQLRRGADDAVLGKAAGDDAGVATDHVFNVNVIKNAADGTDEERRADTDSPHPRRDPERPAAAAPKSDRDLIRLRHGEEAARMFDDLLRRHAPPAGGAAPTPPPIPAPGESALVSSDLPPPTGNQPFQAAEAG